MWKGSKDSLSNIRTSGLFETLLKPKARRPTVHLNLRCEMNPTQKNFERNIKWNMSIALKHVTKI